MDHAGGLQEDQGDRQEDDGHEGDDQVGLGSATTPGGRDVGLVAPVARWPRW